MNEFWEEFNRAVVKQTITNLTSRVIQLAHRMQNSDNRYTADEMDALTKEFTETCDALRRAHSTPEGMMGRSQRVKGATFERDIAHRVGGKRNIGQARDGGDDITVAHFRIECKRRKTLGTVQSWLAQATAACTRAGDVPVVVARADHGEPLVLMRFDDWLQLAQPVLDAARSLAHTASYATALGRPEFVRPAPAAGLHGGGGVRRGSPAASQSADPTASARPKRRPRGGAPAEARAGGADDGRTSGGEAKALSLQPPSEAPADPANLELSP